MGHRASYAIKEHRQIRYYASHWSAVRVPSQVAWGPEALLATIHWYDSASSLMNEAWCEGAAGVDFDARELVYFGGEDEATNAGLRQALLALTRRCWVGWTVRWAHDGVADVAEALGLDRNSVTVERPRLTQPTPERDYFGVPRADEEQTVVTLRGPHGVRHVGLDLGLNDVEELLAHGPALVARLESFAPVSLPRQRHLGAGAVIDLSSRSVAYWYSLPERDRAADLAALWPGWKVARIREGAREHRSAADAPVALSLDEVEPYVPPPDVSVEHDLVLEIAERERHLGAKQVVHPALARVLADLETEQARREAAYAEWRADFVETLG